MKKFTFLIASVLLTIQASANSQTIECKPNNGGPNFIFSLNEQKNQVVEGYKNYGTDVIFNATTITFKLKSNNFSIDRMNGSLFVSDNKYGFQFSCQEYVAPSIRNRKF
jgi:hypothetical protein